MSETETEKKASPATKISIAVLCLVVLFLFIKISVIKVDHSNTLDLDLGGRIYVIWNTKDTSHRFNKIDSVKRACVRYMRPDESQEQKDFYYTYACHGLLKGYVEQAPYIFSIG